MGIPIKKQILFKVESQRVKAVDVHPTESWLAVASYDGKLNIYDYSTLPQQTIKSINVTASSSSSSSSTSADPLRCCRFIGRKGWVAVGSDDHQIRVFSILSGEKVAGWEAHGDYVRALLVHPTQPWLISSSDDMSIKVWDWERGWKQIACFEGHAHFVMALALNPRDGAQTLASGSLDGTVKIWNLAGIGGGSSVTKRTAPNLTLQGHSKGVCTLEYIQGSDKPWLASGSDDGTVRVWDYQTKGLIKTLQVGDEMLQPVSAIVCHPNIPLLIAISEDGKCRMWNTGTFAMEAKYDPDLGRLWALSPSSKDQGGTEMAIGGDSGVIMLNLGTKPTLITLDTENGKVCWGQGSASSVTFFTAPLQIQDGEKILSQVRLIPLSPLANARELGQVSDTCSYPLDISYSPDSKWVVVWGGDGQYGIYSAMAWRNKSFGKGLSFCWGPDYGGPGSTLFAAQVKPDTFSIHRGFDESQGMQTLSIGSNIESLIGQGPLLIVRCDSAIHLFNWHDGSLVKTIDVDKPTNQIAWISKGNKLWLLACAAEGGKQLYILSYTQTDENDPVQLYANTPTSTSSIRSITWVNQSTLAILVEDSSVFLWIDQYGQDKLHPLGYVQGELQIALDGLLGYIDQYLIAYNRSCSVFALPLPKLFLEHLKKQGDALTKPPTGLSAPWFDRLARILLASGELKGALAIARDPMFRVDIASQMGNLTLARNILVETQEQGHSVPPVRWSLLATQALSSSSTITDPAKERDQLALALDASLRAEDLPRALLLASSLRDQKALDRLTALAQKKGVLNILLMTHVQAGRSLEAFNCLIHSSLFIEAALFARTYSLGPDLVERAVQGWRDSCPNHPYAPLLAGITNTTDVNPISNPTSNQNDLDNLSMEVNTTGTGSIRAAEDLDDLMSQMSFQSRSSRHKSITSTTEASIRSGGALSSVSTSSKKRQQDESIEEDEEEFANVLLEEQQGGEEEDLDADVADNGDEIRKKTPFVNDGEDENVASEEDPFAVTNDHRSNGDWQ